MTQLADRSQTSPGLSVHLCGGLHLVLTLPANQNQLSNVPLTETWLPAKCQ